MANEYLISALIDDLRDAGMLPAADPDLSETKLIAMMNREQRVYLTKQLLRAREEYQVAIVDVALVAGTSTYRVPSRAVGAKVKMLEVVGSTGDPAPLYPIHPEQQWLNAINGGLGEWYFRDKNIILTSSPVAAGTLRIHYFRRLNKLVPVAEAGEIASFSSGAKTITIGTPPALFLTASTRYDIVRGTPHFDLLASDEPATRSGSVLTFTNALPADLAAGDFVALAGQSPICQAPVELQQVLVQRGLVKVLESVGDPKAQFSRDMLKELEVDALSLITPRAEAQDAVLINYNAPGWNRFRRQRRRTV